jgi:hypothetical protein
VKKILYSQISGRRPGETPIYKFDWWKLAVGVLLGAVITWGSWVTRMCGKAEKTEDYVDMQVGVLHGRQTAAAVGQEADETRLENRMWELQNRFFEDEIADCTEELEDCEKEKK